MVKRRTQCNLTCRKPANHKSNTLRANITAKTRKKRHKYCNNRQSWQRMVKMISNINRNKFSKKRNKKPWSSCPYSIKNIPGKNFILINHLCWNTGRLINLFSCFFFKQIMNIVPGNHTFQTVIQVHNRQSIVLIFHKFIDDIITVIIYMKFNNICNHNIFNFLINRRSQKLTQRNNPEQMILFICYIYIIKLHVILFSLNSDMV